MQTISPSEFCKVQTGKKPEGQKPPTDSEYQPTFRSILLSPSTPKDLSYQGEPPAFFHDLNLEEVVAGVTHGRDEYALKPFFYTRLTSLDDILYRQEIMRELENEWLFKSMKAFSNRMREMRLRLTASKNWQYKSSKQRWFLAAVEAYCEAVAELQGNLANHELRSQGLCLFRAFVAQYSESSNFKDLCTSATEVHAGLSAIRYSVLIKGNSVTVRHCDSEIDYTAEVEKTFAKFKQGAVKDYRVKSPIYSGMNHVEAGILDGVAKLYPNAFQALESFCAKFSGYLDKTIADFDREIQFYIAYLEYIELFKKCGLHFCYPSIMEMGKAVGNRNGFDLALAGKLVSQNLSVVCNDFVLRGKERIFVVTGPNQGGKTTFARTFGQLHYLAALGCPVPGTEARLLLFDELFTHFEREEDIRTLRGKMQDDLVRIRSILEQATPRSIVIINEIFSSTSVKDGVQLGKKIMAFLCQLDSLCVCVTFLDELASFDEKTVSLVAGVVPENPTQRTFKVERKQADGLAHALAIAKKYRLTYDALKARLIQ